jgi:hypothetical protein
MNLKILSKAAELLSLLIDLIANGKTGRSLIPIPIVNQQQDPERKP